MEYKFKVEFLEPVVEFLESLDPKSREKILYNIWKSKSVNDNELFKKLEGEIWEFRTLYNKLYYRLFAFWDKTNRDETLVIATHGMMKKRIKHLKPQLNAQNF
jgi:phage-related protein